jgi:6-phosphofructo-2-kinase
MTDFWKGSRSASWIFVVAAVPYLTFPTTARIGSSQLLEENIRKVKLSTPDYRDMDPEEAVIDFKQRRENYMRVYETVAEADGSYIKIINSKQFIGTCILRRRFS